MKPTSPIQVPSFYRGADHRSLIATLAASCALHLALIALAVFMASYNPGFKRPSLSVINVTMVSFPSNSSGAKSPGPSVQKAEIPPAKQPEVVPKEKPAPVQKEEPPAPVPVEQKPVPRPPSPEAVSVAKKNVPVKSKESLKKKTLKPAEVVKNAVKRIEAKAESTKPDPLAQALARLEKDVAKGPPGKSSGAASPAGKGLPGGEAGGGEGEGGGEVGTIWDVYANNVVKEQVRKNWAFSEQLAGSMQNVEARLVITIASSGEIEDIWFEARSGNAYLDESAYRAVKKSNPLPPLPPGRKSSLSVLVGFTPSGVQ